MYVHAILAAQHAPRRHDDELHVRHQLAKRRRVTLGRAAPRARETVPVAAAALHKDHEAVCVCGAHVHAVPMWRGACIKATKRLRAFSSSMLLAAALCAARRASPSEA